MNTNSITAGLSRETALQTYAESVNGEDTLFIFLKTLPTKLDRMRELLHDPLTQDEAHAVNDVLYRRRRFCDMIAWLQDDPISWDGYFVRAEFRADEADRLLIEGWRREDEARVKELDLQKIDPGRTAFLAQLNEKAKVYYLSSAHPCPTCGTPAEFLEWSQWSRGFSGGTQTRCGFCLQVVDEFTEYRVTPQRELSPRPSHHYPR